MSDSRVRRFLVVDDSPDDRGTLRRYLREGPWPEVAVTEAATGAEGVRCFQHESPHCVLVHHALPDMDGLELVEHVRYAPGGEFTPIIMLARQGSASVAVNALRAGVCDYISRATLSRKVLNRAVANAIEKAEMRQLIHGHRLRLEQMFEDLKHRNAEIQSFYHTVSHELKTPLTAATEYISMLRDGVGGPVSEDQADFLGVAADACSTMARHLSTLLDVSELEKREPDVDMGPIQINPIIQAAMAMIADEAEERGIALSFSLPDESLTAFGLADRTCQVMSNLLSNAIKFTERGGRVDVQVSRDPEQPRAIRVEVSDTGCGIHAHEQPRIFDRLYQGTTTDESQIHGGLGLGLSLCREIVELQGGQLTVTSRVGHGSTFRFTIPECVDAR